MVVVVVVVAVAVAVVGLLGMCMGMRLAHCCCCWNSKKTTIRLSLMTRSLTPRGHGAGT